MFGKKKMKIRFNIKIEKVEGLPIKMKGNPFHIEYQRGKGHSGISRSLTMTSPNMSIGYLFEIESNLFYEEKKGVKKLFEKLLIIQIIAEKSKETKKEINIAKCEFDLSIVSISSEYEPKQRIKCHGKEKNNFICELVVSFKSEIIKIDGKKVIKNQSEESNNKIQIGDQEYDLKTDGDVSEAGVESDDPDKTENDYLSDSGDFGDPDPFEEDKNKGKNQNRSDQGKLKDINLETLKNKETLESQEKLWQNSENSHKSKQNLKNSSNKILIDPKLTEENQILNLKVLELQKNLEQESLTNYDFQKKLQILESKCSDLEASNNLLNMKIKTDGSLEALNTIESTEIKLLTNLLETLRKENQTLNDKIISGESTISQLKTSLSDFEKNIIPDLKSEIIVLKTQIENLKQPNVKLIENSKISIKNLDDFKSSNKTSFPTKNSKNSDPKLKKSTEVPLEDKKLDSGLKSPERPYSPSLFKNSKTNVKDYSTHLIHKQFIENFIYNANSSYDLNGNSIPALEFSTHIIDSNGFDRYKMNSDSSYSLFVYTLEAIYGQSNRHNSNLIFLIELVHWCLTLMQNLISKTYIFEEYKEVYRITWIKSIDTNGIIFPFDTISDAFENVKKTYSNTEKVFDQLASDSSPPEAFMKLLEQLICFIYSLILNKIQGNFDLEKLVQNFFDQTYHISTVQSVSKLNSVREKPMVYIISQLQNISSIMEKSHLNTTVASQILAQIFLWCSSNVVNSLFSQPELCSASTGMSIKIALSHLEQWISSNTNKKFTTWIIEQFQATREAANVLTIEKQTFENIDTIDSAFSCLNVAQIYKLLSQFHPDDFSPQDIPQNILELLKSSTLKNNSKVTIMDGNILLNLPSDHEEISIF